MKNRWGSLFAASPRVQAVRRTQAAHAAPQSASLAALWQRFAHEHWLVAALLLSITLMVMAIVPGLSRVVQAATTSRVELSVELPQREQDAAAPTLQRGPWKTVKVSAGQTLGQICSNLGIAMADMYKVLDYPGARKPLTQLQVGAELAFDIGEHGALRAIRFDRDDSQRVQLSLNGEQVLETVTARELQSRVQVASAEINSSLFAAGAAAGLRDATLLELANVFGYDIDFAQDIRAGDRFTVVYEEIWRDGEFVRSGDIVAATFVNQGREFAAYRYTTSDGKLGYYDEEGRPVKKSFLRMPIEFARISSRFTSARKHPILGKVRAHQGVDYAARTGTPIRAAGDGRVAFAGWKGGYGRAVILDHGRGYTTLYGHMSRFGKYHTGQRVVQGSVIGYVGASGLATGPHLHYEFRVAGVHRDPLKVTLPKPEPLPRNEMARFTAQVMPMRTQLALLQARRFAAR
ncbi:MAG: peptidoglycan DD-metalloendopeptidase family protein [Xanthomonadaceae bacterium]|nr:peptidoglycan DD-metalloendopeptidase family protein [Xanthomonadaceae bacterium]MDP2184708.1 peptidoglycan DD-metalloendopeptidase family protein [Xanthomonadales bacterium]MDZ4116385.1 peptidoglycan DD-metalloendopeptidase family protein [Xanthomonadaceae bacterium]MDZ4379638.1 peptidoglycan DD-metalloendopeptidase family protein [Xanthomonadaceae bacterium]